MPEIPEVEAFKHIITSHSLHKKILKVEATDSSLIKKASPATFKKNIQDHQFTHVQRVGKFLIISLSSSEYQIIMHFGLTGFLVFTKNADKEVKFSKVRFFFKDGVLHWTEIRKFAKIWLLKEDDVEKVTAKMGLDALKITKKEFLALAQKYQRKNIKAFLMEQSIIAGIGNEYSDEILFQAGIDPHHSIKDLNKSALTKIYQQIKKVLTYAIKLRKADIKKYPLENFLSKADRATFKSSYLQAHRHRDMKCPKNKNHPLKKATIAGRSAYYCPKDQK